MDQTTRSLLEKAGWGFLGFGVPLILLAMYVLVGWGNLPLVILAMTWFGFAVLFYAGLTENDTAE